MFPPTSPAQPSESSTLISLEALPLSSPLTLLSFALSEASPTHQGGKYQLGRPTNNQELLEPSDYLNHCTPVCRFMISQKAASETAQIPPSPEAAGNTSCTLPTIWQVIWGCSRGTREPCAPHERGSVTLSRLFPDQRPQGG